MTNRLRQETSPYLLQHAHNPVDWYPWGNEALERAQKEDKPILLSVGYSACHRCHVMEKESFEDPDTAAVMNRDFVSINVDREERPDLDEIYMHAVQAFTGGHGGWPMTVFLLPDGRPFLGGTYFPPDSSRGIPSFREVMAKAIDVFRNQRPLVERVTDQVITAIRDTSRLPAPEADLAEAWLDPIAGAADQSFDERWAGFGGAPKFPPHGTLAVLLAHWMRTRSDRSLEMVKRTLDAMSRGGMYDLIGGGFARYSVDERWCIPHFEKMLYDNAQLVPVYIDAFAATGIPHYRDVAIETLDYVLREMTDPLGGFYASQDADSEGVEGKFFVFSPRELEEILGADGRRAAEIFSVTEDGSFEHGKSVLRLYKARGELTDEDREFIARMRPTLYGAREKRAHPGRDDKIITSWNSLMISAFARGASALDDGRYLEAAVRAADFLSTNLVEAGRIMRTWKNGRAHILGYLDDYAAFALASLDLHQATLDPKWLERGLEVSDRMIALFWDEEDGGFFYTGSDAEKLVARSKSMLGGAVASGNGTAALLFARLEALTGRAELGEKADRILRSYQLLLDRAPRALGIEALAGAWRSGPTQEIGIAGDASSTKTRAFLHEVHARYLPFTVLSAKTELVPWMEGKEPIGGEPAGYLCRSRTCKAPAREIGEWRRQLDEIGTLDQKLESKEKTRIHAPELPEDRSLWLNVDAPLSLRALAGNVVVLDFWTYCCINCMHVLPELEAIEEQFADRPVVVIGVHAAKFGAEKERSNVERAVLRHRISHAVVLDSEHELWRKYAVSSWPTVMVIDAGGKIAWRRSGEVERGELGRVVNDILREAGEEAVLEPPAVRLKAKPASKRALDFPGKIHLYPDLSGQTRDVDPFGADARLYIADSGHHRILEASIARAPGERWPTVRILESFGSGVSGLIDGSKEAARFSGPQGMYRAGNLLWVADTENHALRRIDLSDGTVKTVAGTGERGRGGRRGDPSKPRQIALRSPWDVAALDDAVLIAMAGTHQIWVYLTDRDQIGPMIGTGQESHVDGEFAQSALAQPSGLALFGHMLFFADSETSSIRLADLREHHVATVVGRGLFDFGDVDGKGESVRLQHPLGVAFVDGKLYVADTFNDKVKVIDLDDAETRTLAGGKGELLEPSAVQLAGDLVLVADTGHHRIVAVDRKTGEVHEIYG
jgi:uncharacterized protein YyaL (SSP411 family)/thiol-disulfide isomerase/thioredoxin